MRNRWSRFVQKVRLLLLAVKLHFTTYKAIKNARTEKFLPSRPKPLSGRKLEREALREYGIRRHPGETDEELRARIMEKVENEYAGTAVVPIDKMQAWLDKALDGTGTARAVYIGIDGKAVKVWERDQQTQKEEGGSNE